MTLSSFLSQFELPIHEGTSVKVLSTVPSQDLCFCLYLATLNKLKSVVQPAIDLQLLVFFCKIHTRGDEVQLTSKNVDYTVLR